MGAHLIEIVGMLLRWLHVIAGIAWIGSSFYFVWLDNSLDPPEPESDAAKKGVAGELWAIHGGGFYNPQKYAVAPASLPRSCTGSSGRPTPPGSRARPSLWSSTGCTPRR
jgi:uncharacterized membrane protein